MYRSGEILRRRHAALAAAIIAVGWAGHSSSAATYSWTGNGGTSFWNNGANWGGNSQPVSSVDTSIVFGGNDPLSTSQNISGDFELNNLSFNTSGGSFSIGGGTLDFRTSSANVTPIINVTDPTTTASVGITAPIVLTNNLSLNNPSFVILQGQVTGAGGLTNNSNFTELDVPGSSTFSYLAVEPGEFRLFEGSLTLSSPGSTGFSGNSSLFVEGGGTFDADSTTLNTIGTPQVHNSGVIEMSQSTWTNSAGPGGQDEVRIGYAGGTSKLEMTASSLTTGSLRIGDAELSQNPGHGSIDLAASSITTGTLILDDTAGTITFDQDSTSQMSVGTVVTMQAGTTFHMGAGGVLSIGGASANSTFGATITSAQEAPGTLQKVGTGTLDLTGTFSGFSGTVNLTGGNLGIASASAPGTGTIVGSNGAIYASGAARTLTNAVSLSSGSVLNIVTLTGDVHNLALNGVISGSGGITVNAPGATTTLGGGLSNLFTGTTSVLAGTLNLAKLEIMTPIPAINGPLVIGNATNPGAPGSVVVNESDPGQINGDDVTIYAGGQLNTDSGIGVISSTIHNLTLSSGLLNLNTSAILLSGSVTANATASGSKIASAAAGALILEGTSTFNVAQGTATYDLDAPANLQSGSLIKTGSGVLRLGGGSNAGLNVAIDAGTLALGQDSALGFTAGTISTATTTTLAGGALVADGGNRTIANPISLTASSTLGASVDGTPHALVFTGPMTVVNDATLTVNNNATTTLSGIGLGTSTLTIAGSSSLTIGGAITDSGGSGALVKAGTGTLTLTGTSSFGGGMLVGGDLVQSGSLSLGGNFTSDPPTAMTINGSVSLSGGLLTGAATIDGGGVLKNLINPLYVVGAQGMTINDDGTLSAATGSSIELSGLLLNNGHQTGLLDVNFGGFAAGVGTFGTLSITSGGVLSPGTATSTATSSPAAIVVTDGLACAANSTTLIDLAGSNAGSGFDQIIVDAGGVSLGGTLQIEPRNNFVPNRGSIFSVITAISSITGKFSQIAGQEINSTTWLAPLYQGNLFQLGVALPGDANLDGTVNTADFNLLAADFNKSAENWPGGDFNGDGLVNAADFDALATNYGQTILNAPTLGALVPEPSVFAAVCLLAIAPRRKRRG